jgi:spore coat polysaccharide biosynthesis protein SpsF
MLNINKSLNKKIILEILNFNFINEEVCVNPRISEFYYKNFYICKMGSPEYMKLSFNEQIIIFKNKLKEIIVNNKLEFPIEYIQFILDTDKYKSLYNKNILYLLNDNKIRLFYYNTFINICEFEENKFNYEEIMNNYEKVKLQYEIVYLKLNNMNMYNVNDINKVFYENNYCVIFIENIENLIPNTKLIVCNNDSELAKNIEEINKNHSIYIIKNSFCYDTIPTNQTYKFFKNIDTSHITYFDSGIYTNIPYFKNKWTSNNINYNTVKHNLLNYDLTNCLDYETFCSMNKLDPNKKLAVWYINSIGYIHLAFQNEYYEGDLYLFDNFKTIKSIFTKLGYNLIIKEHRKKEKRIKYYLDYINEFDDTFSIFNEKIQLVLKNAYYNYIKPYLDKYKELYPNIIDNKYEKEIFKYSDLALIGSNTSVANILYSFGCKCLFLKNSINNLDNKSFCNEEVIKNNLIPSWIESYKINYDDCIEKIIDRNGLKFDYKGKYITHNDLLYGISVETFEFHKNNEKYIKDILNYKKDFEYKYDHPYYGNSLTTNYEYFKTVISSFPIIKNKEIYLLIPIRCNSSRLPNKIFLDINDYKIVDILIQRCKKINNVKDIIILTTNNTCDDKVLDYCNINGINCFRGSEDNVYDRFNKCCKKYNIKHVCRLTSDNPLFDFEYLTNMINYYKLCDIDYYKTIGGIDGIIEGEIFNIDKLREYENNFTPEEQEHVTKFIINNNYLFNIKYNIYNDHSNNKLFDEKYYFSYIRLTLDTKEDFKLIGNIVDNFKNKIFNVISKDILLFLENNEDLLNINDNIYKEENKIDFLKKLNVLLQNLN